MSELSNLPSTSKVWLWYFFPKSCVAIKEHEVILIDVKSECIRKRDGYKINRSLTPIQKNLGVNILNVNVETGACTYV